MLLPHRKLRYAEWGYRTRIHTQTKECNTPVIIQMYHRKTNRRAKESITYLPLPYYLSFKDIVSS